MHARTRASLQRRSLDTGPPNLKTAVSSFSNFKQLSPVHLFDLRVRWHVTMNSQPLNQRPLSCLVVQGMALRVYRRGSVGCLELGPRCWKPARGGRRGRSFDVRTRVGAAAINTVFGVGGWGRRGWAYYGGCYFFAEIDCAADYLEVIFIHSRRKGHLRR